MFVKLAAVVILGSVAELDRTSVFHGLLSEPVILSPLVGCILGDPMLGLKVGAVLQLFFLGMVSVGGSSPPDGTLASVAVTASAALAVRYGGVAGEVAMPAAILLVMMPVAWTGKAVDAWIRESNVTLLHKLEKVIENDGAKVVEKAVWKSLGKSFLIFALATAVTVLAGILVTNLALSIVPDNWRRALEITGGLILLASVGVALASLKERRALLAYAVVGIVLLVLMAGMG